MKYPGLEVIPMTQWRNGRIIAWVLETHKGEFCTKIISFNALFWECRPPGAPIEVVDKYEATWPTMEKLQTYVNEHFAWDWYEGFPRLAGALGMPLEDLIALPFSRIRGIDSGHLSTLLPSSRNPGPSGVDHDRDRHNRKGSPDRKRLLEVRASHRIRINVAS